MPCHPPNISTCIQAPDHFPVASATEQSPGTKDLLAASLSSLIISILTEWSDVSLSWLLLQLH